MLVAAGMLFGTSCTNDNLEVNSSENVVPVSFKLGLENGLSSRAISDGNSVDKLVYAVFDADGNRLTNIEAVEKSVSGFPATESITLPKGQTFKVAFWAQNAACDAYVVNTDNMTVEVDYTEATNNDESRDAFFQTVEFTVTGSNSINVELKRPFAQINVGVTHADWDAAVALEMTVEKSSVVIKQAATSLDLLTGQVGDETVDVTYELAAIPAETETLEVDTDGDGTKETYKWLSMSYILPAETTTGYAKTTLDGLSFVFDHNSTIYPDITFSEGLNNVPVQRNWRTNILGNILTGQVSFNISIDPAYDGDSFSASINGTSYNTLGDAIAAVQNGETIKLEDETKLQATTDYMFLINKPVTIDLNGNDIVGNKTIFKVVEGGELTIKGKGYIQVENSDINTVIVSNEGGVVNLKGGTLNGPGIIENKKDESGTVAEGKINIQGSFLKNVDISDGYATEVSNNDAFQAAMKNPEVRTIILAATTEPYKLDFTSNGGYPNKESLTIIGTNGTKIHNTTTENIRLSKYQRFTIHNCEIVKNEAKWGMLLFSGGGISNSIYTVSNCILNGVETQGIYLNESASGTVYNIVGCTFNNSFGAEGAVVIQNNNVPGKIIVNVFDCDFSNISANSPKVSYFYADQRKDCLEVNTDLNPEDVICLNK